MNNLVITSGNANKKLAEDIASYLNINLCDTFVGRFNNGETQVMINESVRGKDVFIVQPTCQPANDNLMELLIMIDACKRASASSVNAIIPYYAYSRQDRKTRGREPISAKLIANLLQAAGCNRVITVDLHAGQIQGFFDIPVDHLTAIPVLAKYFVEQGYKNNPNVVVVSPDLGGVTRARKLADLLHSSIAIIEKRRPKPGVAEVMNIIGDVKDKIAIIVDDIVDTAGSLCEGAKALQNHGAKQVLACCSHGILTNPALERITNSCIEQLIITDTIPLQEKNDKIKVLTMSELIARVLMHIQMHRSVSEVLDSQ